MGRHEEAIVIGAGPAGLGAAAELERRGIPTVVLERTEQVASSWRSRYDSLVLNTPRISSTLPRYRMPRSMGRWPTRDAVVEYLEEYARRLGLRIEFGVEVERIERNGGDWTVRTTTEGLTARHVVVATGHDTHLFLPDWPGRESYTGELLHAAHYREPSPFRGKDVLVAGAGNTGSEIAYELITHGASRVRVTMRTPPHVVVREWPRGSPLNYPACLFDAAPDAVGDAISSFTERVIYGDLSGHGLPRPPVGLQTTVKKYHRSPIVDAGFIDALKEGKITIVPTIESFEGPAVRLQNGEEIRPDAIIAATGYERGLEPLVGHLGVLDASGHPVLMGAETHPEAPGLYFNGFRATMSGQLRHMRRDGRAIARAVARTRRRGRSVQPQVPEAQPA